MEINGKKVVDATKGIKINVTKRDTVDGDNKNPSGCAAARAAKRDVPNCISARVHVGRVYVEYKDKWVRYETPVRLKQEIIAFDRGGEFAPGEYQLKPIPPSHTESGQAEYNKKKSGKHVTPRSNATKSPRRVKVAVVKRHALSGVRPRGAVR